MSSFERESSEPHSANGSPDGAAQSPPAPTAEIMTMLPRRRPQRRTVRRAQQRQRQQKAAVAARKAKTSRTRAATPSATKAKARAAQRTRAAAAPADPLTELTGQAARIVTEAAGLGLRVAGGLLRRISGN